MFCGPWRISVHSPRPAPEIAMQVAAPFCVLCGVRCEDPELCRLVDTADVQRALRLNCIETALHYRAVMALPPGERRPLCLFCVNWKRRAGLRQNVRRERLHRPLFFTPLDVALLHGLSPGHFQEPDQRCFERLAACAADPRNGYAAIIPECLRAVLGAQPRAGGLTTVDVLGAWWRLNEQTAFFRFPETARAVRHTLVAPDPAKNGTRRRWRR